MARIRTVKPEYPGHPVMGRQDDAVRLLGILLLNFSDDEGYFLASPAQVRSNCFPFDDDSSKARRCLAQLAEIGYIDVREHPSHGAIGLVVNFTKHQAIDRPKPSKLKTYFVAVQSTTNRRALDDESLLEQGTGNREQGKEQGQEQHPPTPLANEGGVKKPVETVEKPKTRPTPGMDFWSVVMVNLKDELGSQSLRGTAFKLPYEYDTLFRDTWQSRVEDGVLYVGSEDPERTAGALKKYAKRLDDIFDRKFHCKVRFEAEASVPAEVAQ